MSPWGIDAFNTFSRTELAIAFGAGIVLGVVLTLVISRLVSAIR